MGHKGKTKLVLGVGTFGTGPYAGNFIPKFYKSKSFAFRAMEGLCEVDPEDEA